MAINFKSSPKNYKNYKNCSPDKTIDKILGLISPYFPELEIKAFSNNNGLSWGAIVRPLKDMDVSVTYGKGIDYLLAIASGLAEFMERLQCFFLPNEYYPFLRLKGDPFIFYDIFNDKPILLNPVYLNISNGDAAGNTLEEATVQALCELFERYSKIKILTEKIQCPDIPKEFFSPKFNKFFDYISQKFDFKIKDFSLGKGLPVIAIIIGKSDLGFHISVGSATSMDSALERCITEFYQLHSNLSDTLHHRIKAHQNFLKLLDVFSELYSSKFTKFDFLNDNAIVLSDYMENYNLNFLLSNSGEYRKWNYETMDFFTEIQNLFDICKNNKFSIYIKDISWMGFPTIRIRSPDLSLYNKSEYLINTVAESLVKDDLYTKFVTLLRQGFEGIKKIEFHDLLRDPKIYYHMLNEGFPFTLNKLRKTPYHNIGDNINSFYFLFHVSYYFRDFDLSKHFIDAFAISEAKQNLYSQCLVFLMNLITQLEFNRLIRNEDSFFATLQKKLTTRFDINIVNEVLNNLSQPNAILDDLKEVLLPCNPLLGCSNNCYFYKFSKIVAELQKNFNYAISFINAQK